MFSVSSRRRMSPVYHRRVPMRLLVLPAVRVIAIDIL
jgi:hypothetical protein